MLAGEWGGNGDGNLDATNGKCYLVRCVCECSVDPRAFFNWRAFFERDLKKRALNCKLRSKSYISNRAGSNNGVVM